jgi:hypothetical protein
MNHDLKMACILFKWTACTCFFGRVFKFCYDDNLCHNILVDNIYTEILTLQEIKNVHE